MSSAPHLDRLPLTGQRVREHFVAQLEGVLAPLGAALRERLYELADAAAGTWEGQARRDVAVAYERSMAQWQAAVVLSWRDALVPPASAQRVLPEPDSLELIADDVVENKILASRLALAIHEKCTWDLNDLRARIEHLEGDAELASHDVLRPEVVSQRLVETSMEQGLDRTTWTLVQDLVQLHLGERMLAAYRSTNEFLVTRGVLPEIDRSSKVRRVRAGPVRRQVSSQPAALDAEGQHGDAGNSQPGATVGGTSGWGQGGAAEGGWAAAGAQAGGPARRSRSGEGYGSTPAALDRAGVASQPAGRGFASAPVPSGTGGRTSGHDLGGPGWNAAGADAGARPASIAGRAQTGGGSGGGSSHWPAGGSEDPRVQTASTPLARARMRAGGVIGQLRRLLTERAGFDPQHAGAASATLQQAIGRHATQVQTQVHTEVHAASARTGEGVHPLDDAVVERVAVDLRQRSGELKSQATTSSEKATIEIVALMFQSILAEERIPPGVRVWFARLQMPVLRVALSEPEFFGTLQHPARQLIDRMGSCVLGFDSVTINGTALEAEIKRVVQVIEQYPETGRRVFQLVYDEFQKFLARFLTEKGDTQRLVSLAQQVEQRETLAIQYTIELRKMLNDIPVRNEIREFLFKVWAEVLALAAVKHGPQHRETIALKQSAADLVWAASAKPNKTERARVIQDLPGLLQRLRQGMTLMGVQEAAQETHIKAIGDTLADAFLSKTEAIPQARIEAMAKRLANLEDFVADDSATDLPLDAESVELMLGIDASMIEVVADGGVKPNDAMLAWAMELQVGNWFVLDHNAKRQQVQYAWRSDRRQLHLFASPGGKSFLVQARRLAAYLQAGLLVPTEQETLTVRATRDALAKLDANPERLLA